jgi:peptidoglycan/LPS O-acetylase OafA/YrhL
VFWRAALFTFPLVRLPEFLFGAVLALLLTHEPGRRAPGWLVPAALAGLAAGLVLTPAPLFALNHNGLYAPLHAALIWGLATSGGPVQRLLSAPWVQRLGDASFGIYLLHVPIHAWMMLLLGGKVAEWGAAASAAFYLAYLALAIAAGWMAHHWFVEPIATRARRSAHLPAEEAAARQA